MKKEYAMCILALNLSFICGMAFAESSEKKLYQEIKNIYEDFYNLEFPSSKKDIDSIKEKSSNIDDLFINMGSKDVFNHSDGCRLSYLYQAFNYQYYLIDNQIECADNICIFDDINELKYWKAIEDYSEELLACDKAHESRENSEDTQKR